MNTPENLIAAVCSSWSKVLPSPYGSGEFTPHDGITFCNEYIQDVCPKFDYQNFKGLLANSIFDVMMKHPNEWTDVPGMVAQQHANVGGLVIAAWQNPNGPHGHVSVVFPGLLGTSDKWKDASVPSLANVGELPYCKIGVGANWCFGDEPKYFLLNSSIS